MSIKGKSKFNYEDHSETGGLAAFDKAVEALESKLKEGTEYTLYLCDHKKNRSLAANRYYWGVVIKELQKHTGIDTEDLHEFLKFQFNKKKVDITGDTAEIGASTKNLTTEEFIKYIEKVRIWALEKLDGLYIPLPQEVSDPAFQDLYIEAMHMKV